MESLVDLAIKYGDFYTAGMFAGPLAILGLGIKQLVKWYKDKESSAGIFASLAIAVAIGGFIGGFQPYSTAREECEQLKEETSGFPADQPVRLVDGTFEFDLEQSSYNTVQYWLNQCEQLLTFP